MLKQYENNTLFYYTSDIQYSHPNISGISIPSEYADGGKTDSGVPGHPECVLNRRAYKTMGNFLRCQKALDAQSQLYSGYLSHISTYISCPREVQLSKQTHKT